MKTALKTLIPLTLAVDLVCLLLVFVLPRLHLRSPNEQGDWPVNVGLAFVGVSFGLLLASGLLALTDGTWRSNVSRLQMICLAALGAYVVFAAAYLWNLVNGGI